MEPVLVGGSDYRWMMMMCYFCFLLLLFPFIIPHLGSRSYLWVRITLMTIKRRDGGGGNKITVIVRYVFPNFGLFKANLGE